MAKYKETSQMSVNVDHLKSLVKQYIDLGLWSAALFWADKVLAAGKTDGGNEVWLVAKCMLLKGDWHRAVHTITSRGLHKTHLLCHYVAVKSNIEAKAYHAALQMMTDNNPELMEHNYEEIPRNRVMGALKVMLGTAHCALESRGAAAEALVTALRIDVSCFSALEMMLEQHAETPEKEKDLLESLPLNAQCSPPEAALISKTYAAYINRYGYEDICETSTPPQSAKGEPLWQKEVNNLIKRSGDGTLTRARRLLHAACWSDAMSLLDQLGPWTGERERVACLVELKQIPQLFHYAHTLVDDYPHRAVSWFAVGCYYFAIGKNEFARRYLSKAKSLEPGMGEAWLAYGHSFAADNEHDQAMAAYFKACQLLPGCHLPPLYVGVECAQLNNYGMAERFVARAAGIDNFATNNAAIGEAFLDTRFWMETLNPDPHVTHEAAAIAYNMQNYEHAYVLFKKALQDVKKGHGGRVPMRWYILLDNLGHACRKSARLEESISFHEEALSCKPGRAKSYSALGLSYALLGNTEKAVEMLHCAVAKNPDDAISFAMLNELIEDYADIGDSAGEIPVYESFESLDFLPDGGGDRAQPHKKDDTLSTSGQTAGPAEQTKFSDMSMSFD